MATKSTVLRSKIIERLQAYSPSPLFTSEEEAPTLATAVPIAASVKAKSRGSRAKEPEP
jgi:hypothetical protein